MFTPLFQVISILAFALLILATSACSPLLPITVEVAVPLQAPGFEKVTSSNYLSGVNFCNTYGLTRSEYGKRITVPYDYADPSKGSTTVYAYTNASFNPSLPSYVFIDGGPGQNTHGIKDVMNGAFNEIRFDQRGLGCSAPDTYSQYKDPNYYSTANIVRDMDAIRKAFGISKWTVYGVSYGTVPATQYGSKYPNQTTSVVIEGVVANHKLIHAWSYKTEKINILLSEMSAQDRNAFSRLMNEGSRDTMLVIQILFGGNAFFLDGGIRQLRQILPFIIKNGMVQREFLDEVRKLGSRQQAPRHPQQPLGIDENVHLQIFCKELGYRKMGNTTLNYSDARGFFEDATTGNQAEKACAELGTDQENPYLLSDFPVTVPVYYFQGSHDGATLAKGAYEHWHTVPKGKSTFLLAQKGGHNPNLMRLMDTSRPLMVQYQRGLYGKALNAEEITESDITQANFAAKPDQAWKLWLQPLTNSQEFDGELEGIKLVQSGFPTKF